MSKESYDIIEALIADELAETPLGEERVIIRDCLEAYRTMRADNERFAARIADMAETYYADGSMDGRDVIVKSAKAGDKEEIEYMKAWPMVFSDEEHEEVEMAIAVEDFKRDWKASRLSTKGGDE